MGYRRAVASLVAAVAGALVLFPAGVADADEDSEAVFCLSVPQRDKLQEAARTLGIAVPDDPAQLRSWRGDRPDDFTRACRALYTAEKAPPVSAVATALPFLTGLMGAVLAFAAATWRDRVARGRIEGDNLRSAVAEFHEACETYVRSWPRRADTEMVGARRRLVHQLANVLARQPRWTRIDTVLTSLTKGDLGDALSRGWTDDREKSRERRDKLTELLDEVRDTVLRVAFALSAPLRPHPSLTDRTADRAR